MADIKVGSIRTTIEEYLNVGCDICGEDATRRVTFLLNGSRSNPSSKAYGRDDCSWCADDERFACEFHVRETERSTPPDMSYCSTFDGRKMPHMVNKWVRRSQIIAEPEPLPATELAHEFLTQAVDNAIAGLGLTKPPETTLGHVPLCPRCHRNTLQDTDSGALWFCTVCVEDIHPWDFAPEGEASK